MLSVFPKEVINAGSNVLGTTDLSGKKCTYVVQEGDNLWNIAVKKLGDGRKYLDIMKENELNSNLLNVGQKLKVQC